MTNNLITLTPITPENYKLALALSVRPDQHDLVATVQQSLADAYVYKEAEFRLAFSGDQLVGYLLIFPYQSGEQQCVNIVRLMIDHRYQGQGLGRSLLDAALRWIQTLSPTVDRVRISTLPKNETALALYKSVGIVEKGIEENEITFYLEVPRNL